MDKGSIIAKLREHEPELKAAGIEHLRLLARLRAVKLRRSPTSI